MPWHLLADGSSLSHPRIFSLRPGTPTDLRGGVCCRPAGTAVGVATAFGAPIGGLLFAFEELAASFSQALGWQIFFACMLAVLVSDTLRSVQRAVMGGEFGIFEGAASTIIYEASHPWAFCLDSFSDTLQSQMVQLMVHLYKPAHLQNNTPGQFWT